MGSWNFCLPPRDILRLVTPLNVFVIHKSGVTVSLPGFDSVETDVELGAVLGVRIVGVGDDLAIFVALLEVLRTLETVFKFLWKGGGVVC